METTILFHPITSEGDEALLKNPDRGFRMETWCNVGNRKDDKQREHEDPADMLREQAAFMRRNPPSWLRSIFI